MGFRLLLLKAIAAAGGANMGESGFKVDPSSLNALNDPNQRLTNSMVAKSAREKRRKMIADKRAKRCTASEANVVSPIKESMVTQIAREKRRQIIAAKKAMRCTTSNASFLENKNSRSSYKKLQHETSEAPVQKPQTDNPPTKAKKK